jgi:YHS domain-containing protein
MNTRSRQLRLAALVSILAIGTLGSTSAGGPENALCPIGKEPIDPKTPTITYKGHEIGFCCPGCDKDFLAWPEKEKDAFIATVAAAKVQPDNQICPITRLRVDPAIETLEVEGVRIGFADAGARREFKLWDEEQKGAYLARLKAGAEWGDPFMLPACPVSGDSFDAESEPVIVFHEGRQVRLCCEGCVGAFEKDPAKYLKAVDEAMIKDQLPFYPLKTCLVAGEELGDDAVNFIYRNRLVRLCCEGCVKDFEKNAPEMLAKLDEAVMEAQRDSYPLVSCVVVPKDRLGDHKEPHELVVANRLVRLCCSGCEEALLTQPAKYLGMLNEAWEKAGR